MKSRSAKNKGRRLQNLLATKLREYFPTFQIADIRPVMMSGTGMDIQLSSAARTAIPYGFECKCVEALNIWSAIAQAEENAEEGLTPAVVFSRNRMPEPYVAVPLSCFLRLLAGPKTPAHTCGHECMFGCPNTVVKAK
jgi:hypothetical protein